MTKKTAPLQDFVAGVPGQQDTGRSRRAGVSGVVLPLLPQLVADELLPGRAASSACQPEGALR